MCYFQINEILNILSARYLIYVFLIPFLFPFHSISFLSASFVSLCYSILSALSLSLPLPPLLYSFSSFSRLPGRRVAGYHCSSSLKPSAPSRALCSGSNKNLLSILQTEVGISSSPVKVSSCSQKRECQRRKKIQVVKKAGKGSEFKDV